MAGDLPIQEFAAITEDPPPGGPGISVLHEYGRLRIMQGDPDHAVPGARSLLEATSTERLGLEAFEARESASFRESKTERVGAGIGWSGTQGLIALDPSPPRSPNPGSVPHAGPALRTGRAAAPHGFRLQGRIGVGVLVVSGPGALAITRFEESEIVRQVQNGLSWLASESPVRDVTFVHNIDHERVGAADNPAASDYEGRERAWRDEALANLRCMPGLAGLAAYSARLKGQLAVGTCFLALFTKYTLGHFAYAQPGNDPYTVLHYDLGGWGTNNMDRVLAHEVCHIFGAPDEYRLSGCDCGGSWGAFGVPNINCESCAPGGGVDCIMRSNTPAMCRATRYHVGFNGLPSWPHPTAGSGGLVPTT